LVKYPNYHETNPFLYNVKGDWRAVKSYAHLTTRSSTDTKRNSGFFESFSPFYVYNATTKKWEQNSTNDQVWTFASEVTQYSPYGAELENKDALGRHSSAQYGYNYKLPVAVASNSEYRQMGYEGFEDRDAESVINTHFRINSYSSNGQDVLITEEESHTGRFSLKVEGGQKAFVNKRLYNDCVERSQRLDCEPEQIIPPGSPTCSYEGIGIVSNNEIAIPILLNYGTDGPLNPGPSLTFNYSSGSSISQSSYDSQTGLYIYTWIIPNNGDGNHRLTFNILDNDNDVNDDCGNTIMITNGQFAFNSVNTPLTLNVSH